jgi:hypothetical protein
VTTQATKNNPQVDVRRHSAEAKIRQEKRKRLKRNKKENNMRRNIIYTYICIDTRIDYAWDNYSIMSLLFVIIIFFESTDISSLFHIPYFLFKRHFTFSKVHTLELMMGSLFLPFYAPLYFSSITFKVWVHQTVTKQNPGYHYYYYYYQVFGCKGKRKYIRVLTSTFVGGQFFSIYDMKKRKNILLGRHGKCSNRCYFSTNHLVG